MNVVGVLSGWDVFTCYLWKNGGFFCKVVKATAERHASAFWRGMRRASTRQQTLTIPIVQSSTGHHRLWGLADGAHYACLSGGDVGNNEHAEAGFTKPVKPVRPSSGLGRYQTGSNSKFKIELKKMKNSQILQGAMNLMVSNFLKNSFI